MPSNQKLFDNLGALCNMVKRVAIEAGEITLKYYDGLEDAGVQEKGDGSPVSLADQEAEAHIEQALNDITTDIPILGEEAVAEGRIPDLERAEYFWLVDPLDGTKEFINGGDDFTVNIALIRNYQPIMGVVYAPALGALYAGHGLGTAVKWMEDTDKEKSIQVRVPPEDGMIVMASARHGSDTKLDEFLDRFKVKKLMKRGSSLKICVIAEGRADLYPRFGPTCEWDTAAAHAVLNAAGGLITDEQGNTLKYGGHDPKFLNPEFIASSFAWFETADA